MEIFSPEKNAIYKQFTDLKYFTIREICMMKEYNQIGMRVPTKENQNETKFIKSNENLDNNKTLIHLTHKNGIEKWEDNPNEIVIKKSKGGGGRDSISKDEYRILILGKPKYERDKRIEEYFNKYGVNAKPKLIKKTIKRGYVMNNCAIEKELEKEGENKDEIDKMVFPIKKRFVGKKKWKRFIYNHWRPRRFSRMRWSTWETERSTFDKIKPAHRSRNNRRAKAI